MMANDGWEPKHSNAGLPLGIVGGLVIVGVIVILGFATQNWNTADRLGQLIGFGVAFVVAYQAAARQFHQQRADLEPARNVRGAGVGAALISILVMWLFIFSRDVIRDRPEMFTLTSCVRVPVDITLAFGLGHMASGRLVRRHKRGDAYF